MISCPRRQGRTSSVGEAAEAIEDGNWPLAKSANTLETQASRATVDATLQATNLKSWRMICHNKTCVVASYVDANSKGQNMKDLLNDFLEQQRALASAVENKFVDYFRATQIPPFTSDSNLGKSDVLAVEIASPGMSAAEVTARIGTLPYSQGLYVIMTNFDVGDSEPSSFQVPGSDLKAIYRGHSSNVRERVMGHLTHDAYIAMCRTKTNKKPWGAFFKIDDESGDGGVDITSAPYNGYTWSIVVYKMTDSNRALRELAENGFSGAFGTPARSRNEPNTPIARLPDMSVQP
jgi:hypothetical protein